MERKWNENVMENFNLSKLEWKIRVKRWNGKWNGLISHGISRRKKIGMETGMETEWKIFAKGSWNGKKMKGKMESDRKSYF